MNRILALVIGLVVAAFIVRAGTFIVDQRQSAIVFQLGQITRVVTEPGLYFRIPLLQNVEYQDKRILTIDTPVTDRVQTSEKKNLLVDLVRQVPHRRPAPVPGELSGRRTLRRRSRRDAGA